MDSKSRVLNKSPLVLAQPEMGKGAKSIYYEVYGLNYPTSRMRILYIKPKVCCPSVCPYVIQIYMSVFIAIKKG